MPTPIDALSTSDHGDDMQRRLRYQAAYGALVCLHLLDDHDSEGFSEVYCEQQEDFLVKKITSKWVGIQVKTREIHFGPFKADDSTVVSAIERFINLDLEFPSQFEYFVLVANCDFWQVEDNGKNLAYVINKLRANPNASLTGTPKTLVTTLRQRCGCSQKAAIATIIKVRLEGTVPKFEDITASVAFGIGACPKFRDRQLSELFEAAAALINHVLEASALSCHDPLRTHIIFCTDPTQEQVRTAISAKRMSAQLVQHLVESALHTAIGLHTASPLDILKLPLGNRRLEQKMSAGGITFQSIDAAKDHQRSAEYLLQSWLYKYGPSAATRRYEHLFVVVRTHCAEAYDQHFSEAEVFGTHMLNALRPRLRSVATQGSASIFDAQYEHLLGIASLGTEECKIWWSKKFDTEATA